MSHQASPFQARFGTNLYLGLITFTEAAKAVRRFSLQAPLSALRHAAQTQGDPVQCAAALADRVTQRAGASLTAPLVCWEGRLCERAAVAETITSGGVSADFADSLLAVCTDWNSAFLTRVLTDAESTLESRMDAQVRMPDGRQIPRREAVLFFAADGMDSDEAIAAAEELPGVQLRACRSYFRIAETDEKPTAWLASFADAIAEGITPNTLRPQATLHAGRIQNSAVSFAKYATDLQHEEAKITAQFLAGEMDAADWHGSLCALLAPAAFQAALAARGGKKSFLSPEAWSLARERSLGLLNSLESLAAEASPLARDVSAQANLSRCTALFASLAHGDFQEQRRLFAREQGARWERRLLPTDTVCCDGCEKAAARGWVGMCDLPEVGACKCLSNCGCRFVFARGETVPPGDEALPQGMVGFDADWVPLFDLAFFGWDESKYIRGPDGRFIGFATFVGSTYKAMKEENAANGVLAAPTKSELMDRVKQRMGHWSDDKFHSVLGKSIDKELITPGIHTRGTAQHGENETTKAMAAQIASDMKDRINPSSSGAAIAGLPKLSTSETNYVHDKLGLQPMPAGTSRAILEERIVNHAKAVNGDTEFANGVADKILALQKPGADKSQLESNFMLSYSLSDLNKNELTHVAGKLGLDASLYAPLKVELAERGMSPGQMVLSSHAGDYSALRKQLAGEISKATSTTSPVTPPVPVTPLVPPAKSDEEIQSEKNVASATELLRKQFDNPNPAKHDLACKTVLELSTAEQIKVATALGMDEMYHFNVKTALITRLISANDAKVEQVASEHVAAIKEMSKSGNFKNADYLCAVINDAPRSVVMTVRSQLGLPDQHGMSYEAAAEVTKSAIASYIKDQQKQFEKKNQGGIKGGIDCSKLIFWGKPAAECGSASETVAGMRAVGEKDMIMAYHKLQDELNLPNLTSEFDVPRANEAAANLRDVLRAKEAAANPDPVKDEPVAIAMPPFKILSDVEKELREHDLRIMEPTWHKESNGEKQHYGGVVFSPDGKVLLQKNISGEWGFPKGKSYEPNNPIDTALVKIKQASLQKQTIIGLVPNNFSSGENNTNYFLMQSKSSHAAGNAGQWFTPQEAEAAIKQSMDEAPTATKNELAVLKNSQEAYVKLLKGGEQMPAGTKATPSTADALSYLKPVKSLGGSTGAMLVKDQFDNQYVMKKGDNARHVREEFAADKAYAAAGFPTPKMQLVETPQGPVKVAQYIGGLQPINEALAKSNTSLEEKILKEARSGFVMDAVMGNWDVVGASFDNMMVGPDSKVYRIDNGGSLRYRAMGAKKDAKDFGDTVPEMETMRNGTNQNAAKIFGKITESEIASQVHKLIADKSKILAALPEEVRGTVGKRIDWVAANYLKAKDHIPGSATTSVPGKEVKWPGGNPAEHPSFKADEATKSAPSFKTWQDDEPRGLIPAKELPPSYRDHVAASVKLLTPEEKSAVAAYTGAAYDSLNKVMRKCPDTLDCLSSNEKNLAKNIESAIAKQGVLETPITVWRHFRISEERGAKDFLPMMNKAMEEGKIVRIPGFKSTSTSPSLNMHFGNTENLPGHTGFALEIKAKTGAFVEAITAAAGEEEFVQPHGVRYKVTGIKNLTYEDAGTKKTRVTFQLEEV